MGPVNGKSTKGSKPKKRRTRVYSLQNNVEMIKKIGDGGSFASVGCEFGVNESIIRLIYI